MNLPLTLADKNELLAAAFEANDTGEFTRLLKLHPECRWTDDGPEGNDVWLGMAAAEGKLWAVELLMIQGADLKRPLNSTDALGAPEGPLPNACESGNIDLVRYLLESGAQINHTVDGRTRCFALVSAAKKGHLEIVKLLLEHGAECNAAWTLNWTAVDYATNYGHVEVADYLRSVGGISGNDLTSN